MMKKATRESSWFVRTLRTRLRPACFLPDQKLPTIREAVERWQMDHRLVSKAYKRLERLGLVKSVPRSGYFVAVGTSHEIVSRHRFELQSMFERVSGENFPVKPNCRF